MAFAFDNDDDDDADLMPSVQPSARMGKSASTRKSTKSPAVRKRSRGAGKQRAATKRKRRSANDEPDDNDNDNDDDDDDDDAHEHDGVDDDAHGGSRGAHAANAGHDDESFDDELQTEARRQLEKIDKERLLRAVHGVDYDEFKQLGGSAFGDQITGGGSRQRRERAEQVELLLNDAERLLAAQSYEEAFGLCLEVIRIAPRVKRSYELLSMIMELKPEPNLENAVNYLSLASQFHKKDVALWRLVAVKATQAQMYASAILGYRMVLKYDDGHADDRTAVQQKLALCYELNRDDDKAHKEATSLLKATANKWQVMQIASLVYKYGEVEKAIAYMGRHLSALAPGADTEYRCHYANFLATMYRENYLHAECVAFLGLLIGAPRLQYESVVRQLADEAAAAAKREADAARAAGADGRTSVAAQRNLPAMLPLATCQALGLLAGQPDDHRVDDDDDDDDEEAALYGRPMRRRAPVATAVPSLSSSFVQPPFNEHTRVLAADGKTVLLDGNLALGEAQPSIDLITAYACSLAECRGLDVARPLMEFILSMDNEFDLHINIARTMLEKDEAAEACETFERIFASMTAPNLRDSAGEPLEPPAKQLALLLSLYHACAAKLQNPKLSLQLHERALLAFPTAEPVVVAVALELECHGMYHRACAILRALYDAERRKAQAELERDDVTDVLIARFPRLVALYHMHLVFIGQLSSQDFLVVGKAILSSTEFMHAPLSEQRWNKATAQRAHLRARQGAGVGGEVQSLIVALEPVLFADLCAQVGFFLLEHGDGVEDKRSAFRIATNALLAQRTGLTDAHSRRLTRTVQFDAPVAARLEFIAVLSAPSTSEKVKYAKLLIRHAPTSSYVWQMVMNDGELAANLSRLTSDGEALASALPPSERAAVAPLTARAMVLMKQNHIGTAMRTIDEAMQRRPLAPLPALLLGIASVRQAQGAAATPDALGLVLASLQRYGTLRVPEQQQPPQPPTQQQPPPPDLAVPSAQSEQIVAEPRRRGEVAYNIGRALHAVGFHVHAEAFYLSAIGVLNGDSDEMVVRLSAHNLSLLYAQRGDSAKASSIIEQFFTFPH
jgi:tetratricopeptide (TPR) repeat protein